MSKKIPHITRAAMIALVSIFGLVSVSADAQILQVAQVANDCLSPRAAQEATVGGQLIPMQQIFAQNGLNPGDVVERKVCRSNGELYYVLSVYQNGMANTVWINARTGQS